PAAERVVLTPQPGWDRNAGAGSERALAGRFHRAVRLRAVAEREVPRLWAERRRQRLDHLLRTRSHDGQEPAGHRALGEVQRRLVDEGWQGILLLALSGAR